MFVLDFYLLWVRKVAPSLTSVIPQPSTSSVTSDEKVDYVQVDKEKTQALQSTMQEWTDVRQSTEPTKGVKSWHWNVKRSNIHTHIYIYLRTEFYMTVQLGTRCIFKLFSSFYLLHLFQVSHTVTHSFVFGSIAFRLQVGYVILYYLCRRTWYQ